MRNRITQFTALVLLLVGCRQEAVEPITYVTGLLNGDLWQQDGWSFRGGVWKTQGINSRSCNLNTVNVNVEQYNKENFLRQNLLLVKIPPKVGTYTIRDIYDCDVNADVGAQFYLLGADGDVLTAVFDVVESANNKLVVERIDSTARQLTGRLQVTLAAGPKQRSSSTPYDTVRITDCRFILPFEKR